MDSLLVRVSLGEGLFDEVLLGESLVESTDGESAVEGLLGESLVESTKVYLVRVYSVRVYSVRVYSVRVYYWQESTAESLPQESLLAKVSCRTVCDAIARSGDRPI